MGFTSSCKERIVTALAPADADTWKNILPVDFIHYGFPSFHQKRVFRRPKQARLNEVRRTEGGSESEWDFVSEVIGIICKAIQCLRIPPFPSVSELMHLFQIDQSPPYIPDPQIH